jgi:hypothetical protein
MPPAAAFQDTVPICMDTDPKPADTAPDTRHSTVQSFTMTTKARATRRAAAPIAYFFFFGASTMIIWRPSIFGICST